MVTGTVGGKMLVIASNRTSLELKLGSGSTILRRFTNTSNRTSLELKLRPHRTPARHGLASNRTSLELKHKTVGYLTMTRMTSNRTSLELKPELDILRGCPPTSLLIEPVWN